MACSKSEVLELVALIHKDVVNAHHTKVHKVILALGHVVLEFQHLCRQVLLALLQSRQHTARNIASLVSQHIKGFVDVTQLVRQYLTLHLRCLRYLAELVVRHDDTGIVVVLDIIEELAPVGR